MVGFSYPLVFDSSSPTAKRTLFFLLHFGGWLLVGIVVFAWSLSARGAAVAGLDESIWISSGIALTYVYRTLYRRARLTAVPYPWIGLVVLLLSAGGAEVWYGIYLLLLRAMSTFIGHWPGIGVTFDTDLAALAFQPWTISVRIWMICSLLLLSWSALYFCITAIIDMEVARARAARAALLADQARLRALQSQLHPHFLFNVHNGIATLIRANDPDAALSMIHDLSEFLRSVVRKLDLAEISVAEEMALVNQYLKLQRRRFGSRLRATVTAEGNTTAASVPTLILQPLVENALEHGILNLKQGGSVAVSIRRVGDKLVVSVNDDGVGSDNVGRTGLGLRNCRDRLQALYGEDARLFTGPGLGGHGFSVFIEMPYREVPEHSLVLDRNEVAG